MQQQEEVLTTEKLKELKKDVQDGLCTVKCLENHFTEFFIPIINNQKQGELYHDLTNRLAKVGPISPVPSNEIGEITCFERYGLDQAKIQIEWKNGMSCDYLLCRGKRLPFCLTYNHEKDSFQTEIAFPAKI